MSGPKFYTVLPSKRFRHDLKKLQRSGRFDVRKLEEVIHLLERGEKLPPRYKNHRLRGRYVDCEECHIEADWLLIYQRREEALLLLLLRTGTHSELFGE